MEELNISTEEKILAAAEAIFLRDGYSGSRMQDIADHAGINKALLHYYFRSKDKLFESIFDKKIGIMFPQMEELFVEENSFCEIICAFVEKYIAILTANPFLPLFVINTVNKPDRQDFIDKMPVSLIKKMIERYQRDLILGKVKPLNPAHLVISTLSMCAFPFMAKPIIIKMTNGNQMQFDAFMQSRSVEVQSYLKMILLPSFPNS